MKSLYRALDAVAAAVDYIQGYIQERAVYITTVMHGYKVLSLPDPVEKDILHIHTKTKERSNEGTKDRTYIHTHIQAQNMKMNTNIDI
jgi:hypothetical protein